MEALLNKPTAPAIAMRQAKPSDFTRQLEVKGDKAEATINTPSVPQAELEGKARDLLVEYGLDPAEWIVTGFKSAKWTPPGSVFEGVSAKFTFGRRGTKAAPAERIDLDEIVSLVMEYAPSGKPREVGEFAYIVALGDMQFGKIDGDGAEGALLRTIESLNRAADLLAFYRKRFNIGHIHIAWLGDHVEGFVSQGGANVWRTTLTLNEQIRLTRRVMTHAMLTFAPLAERVTMAAVPGNHGEPQRFAGKGVTRYDDSHDTESLIAVRDAAELNPAAFGHVEFYVPDTDELTVVLDLAGTLTGHVHGEKMGKGKHFQWWKEQAFGGSPLALCKLLLAGHMHHELIEGEGDHQFIQVPALESESTWFRHSRGVTGNPGIVVAITKDGNTSPIEILR